MGVGAALPTNRRDDDAKGISPGGQGLGRHSRGNECVADAGTGMATALQGHYYVAS